MIQSCEIAMFKWIKTLVRTITVLSFFWTLNAQADHQKVVLLTSLDTQSIRSLFRKTYFQTYVQNLEELFVRKFTGTQYVIEIVHRADQFHLWSALHDPKNVAIFWLSHASSSGGSTASSQLLSNQRILDSQGFDVTPIFNKIHPNLRFLAVIGCFSQSILNQLPHLSQDPKHSDHPYLRLFTFNHKVDARIGLKKAIQESKRVLDIPEIRLGYSSPCPRVPGYRIRISRGFNPSLVDSRRLAGRVISGSDPIDVFPSPRQNEPNPSLVQVHDVFAPAQGEDLPSFRIDLGENNALYSDKKALSALELGDLEIVLKNLGQSFSFWNRWQTPDGKPIGVFSHKYKLQTAHLKGLDLSAMQEQASEFRCEPMPSYD